MVYVVALIAFVWLLNRLVLIERTNKGGRPRWAARFRKQSLGSAMVKIVALALTGSLIVKLLSEAVIWVRMYWQSILVLAIAVTIAVLTWRWLPRIISMTTDAVKGDAQALKRARACWQNGQNDN